MAIALSIAERSCTISIYRSRATIFASPCTHSPPLRHHVRSAGVHFVSLLRLSSVSLLWWGFYHVRSGGSTITLPHINSCNQQDLLCSRVGRKNTNKNRHAPVSPKPRSTVVSRSLVSSGWNDSAMMHLGFCFESDGEEPQVPYARSSLEYSNLMSGQTHQSTFPFQKPLPNMSGMFSRRPGGAMLMTILATLSIVDVTEGHAFLAVPMSRNWRVSG